MSIPVGPFRRVPIGGGTKLPPYLPLAFPNTELYLDSRLGVSSYSDGALLTNWPDQSGHSPTRDAVSQSGFGFVEPKIWSTTASHLTPRGMPSVEWGLKQAFPGNILASSGSFAWPTASRGYTFYFYARCNLKLAPPYPFFNQAYFGPTDKVASFLGQLLIDDGSGGRYTGAVDNRGGGNPHTFPSISAYPGLWKLHTILFPTPMNDTVPMKYYVNAVEQSQIGGPANWLLSTPVGPVFYTLGNLWNGNTTLLGHQGFFVWYSDYHSPAQIALHSLWADVYFGLQ